MMLLTSLVWQLGNFSLNGLYKILLTSLGSIQPRCSYCIKLGTWAYS